MSLYVISYVLTTSCCMCLYVLTTSSCACLHMSSPRLPARVSICPHHVSMRVSPYVLTTTSRCVCLRMSSPRLPARVSLQKLSFGKVGFSKAMSNKWVKVDKTHEGGPRVFRAVRPPCLPVSVCLSVCLSVCAVLLNDAGPIHMDN